MGEFNPWIVPVIAAALVLGSAIYVQVRWRRAPVALRAIGSVGGICFVAGFLVGVWAFHIADNRPVHHSGETSESALLGDSVPALEVGKEIVNTDEKHAGDSDWASCAATAELCNEGGLPPDAQLCRIAYLGRHAEGKDLERGPREHSIALSDYR